MMVNKSYIDLDELILTGKEAYGYAWKNYEELNSRNALYVLYGPPTYLGVFAAAHLTPARDRKIQKKTRREKYVKYELDQEHRVIRVRHMKRHDEIDCTYHMFSFNGRICGVPFFQDKKIAYPANTVVTKVSNNRPEYFALTKDGYLCVDYYEYPQPNLVHTTCYLYYPKGKYTASGMLAALDAPYGAQNSPVTIECFEEEYCHIEFTDYI